MRRGGGGQRSIDLFAFTAQGFCEAELLSICETVEGRQGFWKRVRMGLWGTTDMGYCTLLLAMSTTLTACKTSDCSNRSFKPAHKIFPPALQNISVTRDRATVLAECKTNEKCHEFLAKHRLLTQQDVGLLASLEASFETKRLPLLKVDKVPADGIADIVSLVKAWLACRGAGGP